MVGRGYDYKKIAVDGFKIHRKRGKIQIEFLWKGRHYANSVEYEISSEETLSKIKQMLLDYTSANARLAVKDYEAKVGNKEFSIGYLERKYNGFKIGENGLKQVELLCDGESSGEVKNYSLDVYDEYSYEGTLMSLMKETSRNAGQDSYWRPMDWLTILYLIQHEIE